MISALSPTFKKNLANGTLKEMQRSVVFPWVISNEVYLPSFNARLELTVQPRSRKSGTGLRVPYGSRESVQLRLAEYRPAGFREDRFLAASRVYEEICRGEGCDKRLAPRVIPQSRAELMAIYDLVRRADGKMPPEDMAVFGGSVNYCMLRITLDAFAEAGMIEYLDGAPRTVPVKEKRDLFQSGLIAELTKQLTVGSV